MYLHISVFFCVFPKCVQRVISFTLLIFSWHLYVVDSYNRPFMKTLVSYHFCVSNGMSGKQLKFKYRREITHSTSTPICLFLLYHHVFVLYLVCALLSSVLYLSSKVGTKNRIVYVVHRFIILTIELINMRCSGKKTYRINSR